MSYMRKRMMRVGGTTSEQYTHFYLFIYFWTIHLRVWLPDPVTLHCCHYKKTPSWELKSHGAIGNKVLDLADGQHQKDSWSIVLRLHAPLIRGRDIKQVCHFISWRTHLKFGGGCVLILDLSCGTSYFAKINEFIIIHSSGTFCRLRYLFFYFWVLRPETFPAKVLPIMVSLRGRCLEVMTCSEGAMDWIRMMGWLGS